MQKILKMQEKYKKVIDEKKCLCYIIQARLILGLFFMLKISK